MHIENPIYLKRNVLRYGTVSLLLQAAFLSLLSIRSQAGNFAFLLYILIALFSVITWVFLFWQNVEIARSFSLRITEGVITLRRGFILKETLTFPAAEISRLLVKGKGEFADITMFLNQRKIVALCQPVFVLEEIMAELPQEAGL
ncbi:MAG: hypothetical protein E7363_03085 [Clostridiales bacterium]|nr:hypothetical protein [Clostridiales bacterium]